MHRHYNPNPSGLMVDDCTIRALCCLEGMSWEEASLGLYFQSFELRDVQTSQNTFNAYLKRLGYVRHQIPDTCPDCYTVADFCNDHPLGRYIIATHSHVIAIIDGDDYDTWDAGFETILYYWEKGK